MSMEINRITSFLVTTGAVLLTTSSYCIVRRVSATTSTPSSSTEICLLESATCYDAGLCWDCVAQFVDAADCAEQYPVLADDGASECEVGAAMLCCSFDASVEDCLGDAVTMDYFQCGLDESGCSPSDSPCSGDDSPAVAPTPTSPNPDDTGTTPTTGVAGAPTRAFGVYNIMLVAFLLLLNLGRRDCRS